MSTSIKQRLSFSPLNFRNQAQVHSHQTPPSDTSVKLHCYKVDGEELIALEPTTTSKRDDGKSVLILYLNNGQDGDDGKMVQLNAGERFIISAGGNERLEIRNFSAG